jgi:type IV pilus assembly protein PilW
MKFKPEKEEHGSMPWRSSVVTSQRGFSLIELMIAILLSVFLIGGLLTLVQAMKRTTGVQNGLSQLQDNERFATDLLSDVIQAAGDYPAPAYGGQYTAFPALPLGLIAFAQGQTIAGADTALPGGALIGVRYTTSGTDGLISCAGNTSAAPVTFVNVFSIDGQQNLQCQLTTIDAAGNKTTTTTRLVSGITNLTILYGVQTNSLSNTQSVDAYLTAAQVSALVPPLPKSAPTGWILVKTVRLVLTVTNPLAAGVPSQPPTLTMLRVINVMNQVGEGQ